MKRTFTGFCTTWAVISSLFLTTMAGGTGLVFCADPDGRVALEQVHRATPCTDCSEGADTSDPSSGIPQSEGIKAIDCDCVDIPASISEDLVRPRTDIVAVQLSLFSWAPPGFAALPRADALRPISFPPDRVFPRTTPKILRSVILLI